HSHTLEWRAGHTLGSATAATTLYRKWAMAGAGQAAQAAEPCGLGAQLRAAVGGQPAHCRLGWGQLAQHAESFVGSDTSVWLLVQVLGTHRRGGGNKRPHQRATDSVCRLQFFSVRLSPFRQADQ
ncbi:MAG: hypothetical protein CV045_13820, partial [Cyanobacteria bacterium M5B4]